MTLKDALEGLSLEGLEPEDSEDFVQRLMKQVRGSQVAKFALKSHELRRRDHHLYYRVRMVATQEPDKVLIFQVDWIQA
jgi:hypothetical protein